MPGIQQATPACPPRLSDRVAIGVLTRTYPPELVDRVLAQTGRVERRQRLLPARLMVSYVLALALFAGVAYEAVLRWLVEALRGAPWWPNPREPWRVWRGPAKSALVQARARLGAAPLRVLFEQAARPLAAEETQGAWYRGRRLVAIDGTCLDVADTPANQQGFGRPQTGRGQGVGAFPQVRLVALAECGTHAITKVAVGPTAPARPPWLLGCWTGWGRGCWPWPTGACWRERCGARPRRAAPSCCGGPRPAPPGTPSQSTRCSPMGRGCRGWTLVGTAAATRGARSWSGCSTTPSTTPAGPATSSAIGW